MEALGDAMCRPEIHFTGLSPKPNKPATRGFEAKITKPSMSRISAMLPQLSRQGSPLVLDRTNTKSSCPHLTWSIGDQICGWVALCRLLDLTEPCSSGVSFGGHQNLWWPNKCWVKSPTSSFVVGAINMGVGGLMSPLGTLRWYSCTPRAWEYTTLSFLEIAFVWDWRRF